MARQFLGSQGAATLVLGTLVALPVIALIPASGSLFSERELAAALELAAKRGEFSELSDIQIRRALQKMGREHGFQLATGDVMVVASDPLTADMVAPASVGYTLPMLLPLLWVFDFEVVAVRTIDLPRTNP
jgi:hypothetical protein